MRRSGLLIAVLAAVGTMVAFGPNPGAAQPQPRAHVYLLRGLMNIFSLGMDTLAEELKRHDIDATVHNYAEWQTLADAVMEMAAYLGRKGVPVALVVPFDGTQSFAASGNVARVLNLTQRKYAYMRGGPGFHGTLTNVDVSSDKTIDHITIDKSPRLHARVVAEVLAVVGNRKAFPAKHGAGADAGIAPTLPEQGGSRQNGDKPAPPPRKLPAVAQPLQIPN